MIGTNCQIWKIMISHRWGGQIFGGGCGGGGGVGVGGGGGDGGGDDEDDLDIDDDDEHECSQHHYFQSNRSLCQGVKGCY